MVKMGRLLAPSAFVAAALCFSAALGAGGLQSPPSAPTEPLRTIAIAVDPAGNLIVIESSRIRKLARDGALSGVAGGGRQGYHGDGGPAVEAGFEHADDVAVDMNGNIYVADNLDHRVRKISPDGTIRTVAGTGAPGYSGDGGPAVAAKLQSPVRVALDSAGNLFIADSGNARVRKVSAAGVITTVAGNGKEGFSGDNGPAASASIGQVSGLAVDRSGNIYIADSGNARIRKVAANGILSTIAGNGTEASSGDDGPALQAAVQPLNLAADPAGNLFLVEVNRIRKIGSDGVIRAVAGNGLPGFIGDGGAATGTELRGTSAVAADANGNLFIADALNGRIRKVSGDGVMTTIAGSAPPPPVLPEPPPTTSNAPFSVGSNLTFTDFVGGIVNIAGGAPTTPPTVAPSGRPVLLETRLTMIPRPALTSLKDCGHVPKDAADRVVTCVEQALSAKTPFIASFEQKGASQTIGLGGTAPDGVVQVQFDGASGSTNSARVSSPRDCRNPRLTAVSGAVQVACQ
jgi:hypothetical protein